MERVERMEKQNSEIKNYRPLEVAKILGITKKTLLNWEKQNKLPFTPLRDLRNWRYYSKKQVNWLRQNIYELLGQSDKGGESHV